MADLLQRVILKPIYDYLVKMGRYRLKTLFFNKSRGRAESITNLLFQFIKCSWQWLAACILAQPHKNSHGVRLRLCGKNCAGPWHTILWPRKWLPSHAWTRSTNVPEFHLAWSAILHNCLIEKQWEQKLLSIPFRKWEPFNIMYLFYNHIFHLKGCVSDNQLCDPQPVTYMKQIYMSYFWVSHTYTLLETQQLEKHNSIPQTQNCEPSWVPADGDWNDRPLTQVLWINFSPSPLTTYHSNMLD